MQITKIGSGDGVEKTLMQCIISYFEVLFSLNFWMKEGLLHHVEIFRQTGLFKNCQCIIQTSEIFTSSIWKNGHSRMEPWSPERYHLPSDSGLYLLYLLFNLLQNTKSKRRAVCFAQNVFLSEKKIRFDLWSILCDGKNAFRYFTKPELKCGKSGKTTTLFENLKVKQISLNKIFVLYSNKGGEIFSLSLSSEKFGQTVFQSLFNL